MAEDTNSHVYRDSFTYNDGGTTSNYDVLVDSRNGAIITGNSNDGYVLSVKNSSGQISTHSINNSQGHSISEYSYLLNDGFQDAKGYNGLFWTSPKSSYGNNDELMPLSTGAVTETSKYVNIDGRNVKVCVGNEQAVGNPFVQYAQSASEGSNGGAQKFEGSADGGGNSSGGSSNSETGKSGSGGNSKGSGSKSSGGSSKGGSAGGTSGESSQFPMSEILNGAQPVVAEILYEPIIPEDSVSIFDGEVDAITGNCNNIVDLAAEVIAALESTQESKLNDATMKSYLSNASNDASTMNTAAISSPYGGQLAYDVGVYNINLKRAKKHARIELLKQKIDEINGIVKEVSYREMTTGWAYDYGASDTKRINDSFIERKEYSYKHSNGEAGQGITHTYSVKISKVIDIKKSNDYKKMETDILNAGKELPYDVGAIVDFED